AGRDVARELLGRESELAQAVAGGDLIPEARCELPVHPRGTGEAGPEEFVGEDAVVGEPEGMRAHHRSAATNRVDARVGVECLRELVARVAVERRLVGR